MSFAGEPGKRDSPQAPAPAAVAAAPVPGGDDAEVETELIKAHRAQIHEMMDIVKAVRRPDVVRSCDASKSLLNLCYAGDETGWRAQQGRSNSNGLRGSRRCVAEQEAGSDHAIKGQTHPLPRAHGHVTSCMPPVLRC